ncbi:transposase [Candidatus Daviesbacteria bacterium]|nr:transposase [Candidatus Daviesbacteria bacterium]
MPYRKTPLITDEVYHVFNRSIAGLPIFLNNKNYQRALDTINFYRFEKPGLRFSHYNRLPMQQKSEFLENLKSGNAKRVRIWAYCLMPNHIHFVLKQLSENGIANFMSNVQESYAKYFNIREERTGALFQSMFKAVRIETDEQLIHVVRYIHLNPLTAYVIRETKELETYPWCSFVEYINRQNAGIADKEDVLSYFSSLKRLKDFTYDQVDYQRKLAEIKHLALE